LIEIRNHLINFEIVYVVWWCKYRYSKTDNTKAEVIVELPCPSAYHVSFGMDKN
jgi:hypothetical protein